MSAEVVIEALGSTLSIEAVDPSSLVLRADDATLVLAPINQNLILGIPQPFGVGEANAAANVGGEAGEVFRDAVAGVLNFRTLVGTGSTSVSVNGDTIEIDSVGGGSAFLPAPDLQEDTNATYFYFGWTDVSGSWLVRRQLRADSTTVDATIINNPGFAVLATAWATKETLVYA